MEGKFCKSGGSSQSRPVLRAVHSRESGGSGASNFTRELAAGPPSGPSIPRLRQLQRVPALAARSRGARIRQLHRNRLRPIAGDQPLLISEFGVNTIEAGADGQSRLSRRAGTSCVKAGAAGGVVFEFADEWWKNYDNPARPGDWWTRVDAPDDELRHDTTRKRHTASCSDRTPKPALPWCPRCLPNAARHCSDVRHGCGIGDRVDGRRGVDMGTSSPCGEDDTGPVE